MDNLNITHEHSNKLIRKFCKTKIDAAIKLANLKKEDIILDFGCGAGILKKTLPCYNIIGYDITPEQSDINDYTKLSPNKIFVLDVFEHLTQNQIKETIKNFKKMNKNFTLITAIPTENSISTILRKLTGKPARAIDHITRLKDIKKILNKELKLIKTKSIFTMSHVCLYKNKEF